jgi:hypothetical protein
MEKNLTTKEHNTRLVQELDKVEELVQFPFINSIY